MTEKEFSAMSHEEKSDYLVKAFNGCAAWEVSEDVYDLAAKEIAGDMRRTARIDPLFLMEVGHSVYTPEQIAEHVEGRTITGMKFVTDYVAGLKGFKR